MTIAISQLPFKYDDCYIVINHLSMMNTISLFTISVWRILYLYEPSEYDEYYIRPCNWLRFIITVTI